MHILEQALRQRLDFHVPTCTPMKGTSMPRFVRYMQALACILTGAAVVFNDVTHNGGFLSHSGLAIAILAFVGAAICVTVSTWD